MPDHDDRPLAEELRAMTVPGHRPGFWIDLDARLAAVDAGDESAGPRPVVAERAVVPLVAVPSTDPEPEPRREDPRIATSELPALPRFPETASRRHTGRWMAAAAAVLVIGAGAVAVGLSQGGGRDTVGEVADAPTATTGGPEPAIALEDVPAPEPEVSTTTTLAPRFATADSPEAAVDLFLVALGAGDEEAAARTLGPRTVRYITSLVGADPGDDDPLEPILGYVREAQEGYGPWGGVEDRTYTTIDLADAVGDEVAIVLVSGTYTGEGTDDGDRVDAFVAVADGEQWLVEWQGFDPEAGGRIEFTSPQPADGGLDPIEPGGAVEAFFANHGTVAFVLDGELLDVVDTSPVGGNDAPFARVVLPEDLDPGDHHLAVAFVGEDAVYAEGAYRLVVVE